MSRYEVWPQVMRFGVRLGIHGIEIFTSETSKMIWDDAVELLKKHNDIYKEAQL